jgi:hypothetical protein
MIEHLPDTPQQQVSTQPKQRQQPLQPVSPTPEQAK